MVTFETHDLKIAGSSPAPATCVWKELLGVSPEKVKPLSSVAFPIALDLCRCSYKLSLYILHLKREQRSRLEISGFGFYINVQFLFK